MKKENLKKEILDKELIEKYFYMLNFTYNLSNKLIMLQVNAFISEKKTVC